jgi:hypothetical protein
MALYTVLLEERPYFLFEIDFMLSRRREFCNINGVYYPNEYRGYSN